MRSRSAPLLFRLFCPPVALAIQQGHPRPRFTAIHQGRLSTTFTWIPILVGFPFPILLEVGSATIPFDAILYRSVSLLRQVHHILTITFAGLGIHPVGRGIFADLRPDFSSTGFLTIHIVHATNAQLFALFMP